MSSQTLMMFFFLNQAFSHTPGVGISAFSFGNIFFLCLQTLLSSTNKHCFLLPANIAFLYQQTLLSSTSKYCFPTSTNLVAGMEEYNSYERRVTPMDTSFTESIRVSSTADRKRHFLFLFEDVISKANLYGGLGLIDKDINAGDDYCNPDING